MPDLEQIQLSRPCGCGIFVTAVRREGIPAAQFFQGWKDDAVAGRRWHCGDCGSTFRALDDGTPATEGGSVSLQNESPPRIDSISAGASGSTDGGTAVTVEGHSFQVAAPTVKFNGVAGTNLNVVSDTRLTVDSPAGLVALNHGDVTDGPFEVGETVTVGGSGETAIVRALSPLRVDTLSAALPASGVITGGTSGASATLDATTPMNGNVDVTVESTWGTRPAVGQFKGTLAEGFEYQA